MTMDVVAETTESSPAPRDARPLRSGVSVRVRLTATVALLVALALAGAGLIVYLIEAQRIEDQTASEIDQEFAEFSSLVAPANGPAPNFASPEAALRNFLNRNVPDDTEILVGWWDDGPRIVSPAEQRAVVDDPAFAATLWLREIAGNGSTTIPTDDGDLLLTVQSVQVRGETGALVVGTFVDQTREGLAATMRTYAIVAALSLLLITALAAWQSGRLLAPLRTLRETADEITDTDLSRRLPVTGNDDITALTRTVNGMLDRLEAAFVGQRQFLDDAGHELKTPLTVLRGHLELLDTGSPKEIAETRSLLLDEVDRMSRLVGDLILLAKSDRPDFVTTRPVDLASLTADVLAKARGLAERTWTLDSAADGDGAARRAADHPGAAAAVRQRREAHPGRRRDRARLVVRRRGRSRVGPRHRARGSRPGPRPDLRAVRPRRRRRARRGLRARAVDRARHRYGTRWQRARRGRRPLRDHAPHRSRSRGGHRVARILIVEDESRIASFVAKGLRAEGHTATVSGDGHQGLDHALSGDFDLMVLDIGLPGIDGFAVLDQLRAQGSRLPVIVLTARDSVTDTVSALEGGADDYMPKPFRFAELMARIRLRLRQDQGGDGASSIGALDAGGIHLDLRTRRATVGGKQVDLSAREFMLAEIFMRNAGQVLSREQLLDHAWELDFDPGSNVVDVYVGYLRKKFGTASIATVRGMGYRFLA